jgi:hypothetical protein
MTQEELNNELMEIIDSYDNPVEVTHTQYELRDMLRELFNRHVDEVIGRDEAEFIDNTFGGPEDVLDNPWARSRNKLKAEQRKRAGLIK